MGNDETVMRSSSSTLRRKVSGPILRHCPDFKALSRNLCVVNGQRNTTVIETGHIHKGMMCYARDVCTGRSSCEVPIAVIRF
jgi:hypothetical protein